MAGTGSLISVTGISSDPLAGYTATMNFLCSPAGQVFATDLHDVVVDLIKFFHSKNPALPLTGGTTVTATIMTSTSTSKP